MVWRMLSTTTWQGLQPAMCCSNSAQKAGSTVPSTYSFNIASSSSHFMVFVSLMTEPSAGQKLQALWSNDFSFVRVRRLDQPPFRVAEHAGQFLAQLQPGAEQSHFHIGLAQVERLGGFLNGQALHVAQQKHETMLVVQPCQRVVQQTTDFIPLRLRMILRAAWLAMRSTQVEKLASPRKPARFSSTLKKVCWVTSSASCSCRS